MNFTKRFKNKKFIISSVLILVIILFVLLNNFFAVIKDDGTYNISKIKYDNAEELNIDMYSNNYLLLNLNKLEVLYCKDIDEIIYPASLTKVMTMLTVLNKVKDLNDISNINQEERKELIDLNASLAYLNIDQDYTIEDLLYALILPSGADASKALEKYFENRNMNLLKEMKKIQRSLRLENTSFMNTNGLHNDNHYTTIKDLLKITLKVLNFKKGREILKSESHILSDGLSVISTIPKNITDDSRIKVLGGKTGYTPEAGLCLILLYEYDNNQYLWISSNAQGEYQSVLHLIDAYNMFNEVHLK